MKSLFHLFLLAIPFGLFSQSTLPLIEDEKEWSCYGDYFFLNVKYRMGEDTLINNKLFKKVLAHGSEIPYNFDVNQAQYKSAIREENGVISVVEKNFIAEHILYNFNKETGDTIRFYRPIGDFNQGVLPNYSIGKVYKTDYITIQGVNRKRLFIHDPFMVDQLPPQALSGLDSQADIWIEGLGGVTGLFSRMPQWGVIGPEPYLLTCVSINGNLIYLNNQGYEADPNDPCFITPDEGSTIGSGSTGGEGSDTTGVGGNDSLVLKIDNRHNHTFELFPNPTSSFVQIKRSSIEPVVLTIFNSRGQTVMHKTLTGKDVNTPIETESLSKGIYYVTIVSGVTPFETQKLVIQ